MEVWLYLILMEEHAEVDAEQIGSCFCRVWWGQSNYTTNLISVGCLILCWFLILLQDGCTTFTSQNLVRQSSKIHYEEHGIPPAQVSVYLLVISSYCCWGPGVMLGTGFLQSFQIP